MRGEVAVSGSASGHRPHRLRTLLRFGTSSIVATVSSEITFLLLYGPAHRSSTLASVCGWVAGAIPNYWINRSWTWGLRGRPSLSREVIPYAAIVFATLGLAIAATNVSDSVLRDRDVSDGTRTVLVGGAFLSVYAVMFLVRFLLFDRLFTGRWGRDQPPGHRENRHE
jgi:putative flippase GtrA